MKWRTPRRWIYTGLFVLTLLLVPSWFLGVEESLYIDHCPDCGFSRDVIQDRLLGRSIRQRLVEHPTPLQEEAIDLGAECPHRYMNRWHKQRHWGLCLCAWPCHNGMTWMDGGPWYDESARAWVKEQVKANPALREEFVEQVFRQGDRKYWLDFAEQIRRSNAKAAEVLPA